MSAAFSTSTIHCFKSLSAINKKNRIENLGKYLWNIDYKYKPWDWTRLEPGWHRVHGDRKSLTRGETTTWLLKGGDGKYHWALVYGDGKSYIADNVYVRGVFDQPPTADEVMEDVKAKIKEEYGVDI